MAVQFSAASARPATIQTVYTQLHATLTAAGWELVYADADAIGTGTPSNPAWTKTPAQGTSAGIVIYRMPLVSGYPTRWCVRFNPKWGNTTGLPQNLLVQIGTDATAGGVLSVPGTQHQFTHGSSTSATNTTSTEWYVSAYEHGVLIAIHAATVGWMVCVDRRRKRDSTILDDVNVYGGAVNAGTGGATIGATNTASVGMSQARSVTGGEYTEQDWVVQASSRGTVPYTLNSMDGTTGIPQGPVNVSGGTSGIPRLFTLIPTNDATVGVDTTYTVDGATRAYHTTTTSGILSSSSIIPRVCYAKE